MGPGVRQAFESVMRSHKTPSCRRRGEERGRRRGTLRLEGSTGGGHKWEKERPRGVKNQDVTLLPTDVHLDTVTGQGLFGNPILAKHRTGT